MQFYRAYKVYEMKINYSDDSGFLSLSARELSRSIIFFSNTRIVPGGKRILDRR